MKRSLLLLFIVLTGLSSCTYWIYNHTARQIATVDNNVCKKLTGDVVLYAIFVDSRYTQPWSEYDIKSTLDSINKAAKWVEKQASENGIGVNIKVVNHENRRVIPISADFANKTLSGTIFSPVPAVGVPKVDRWADRVAKTAAQSLPKDTTNVVKTKNKLSDRERLIARLRDIYKTDNVVLMYFVNNYYKEEMSVTFHNSSFSDIEYCVVSFKKPAVIAHEFLHIFGALDLYVSPFDKKRSVARKKQIAMKEFPNEIMAFAYRNIDSLSISPFTKYCIGWENQLDEKYIKMLLGRRIKVIKY